MTFTWAWKRSGKEWRKSGRLVHPFPPPLAPAAIEYFPQGRGEGCSSFPPRSSRSSAAEDPQEAAKLLLDHRSLLARQGQRQRLVTNPPLTQPPYPPLTQPPYHKHPNHKLQTCPMNQLKINPQETLTNPKPLRQPSSQPVWVSPQCTGPSLKRRFHPGGSRK